MALTFPSLPSAEEINARLDELESRLPAIPARLLRLQRSIAASNCERTNAAVSAVTTSAKSFFETARNSGATVAGQARAAVTDVVGAARTGANTVTGQAVAQGKKVASAAESQTTKLVDQAIDAVDDAPGSGTPYEEWTKAQLVERAKELKVVGPTRMSKDELIAALRAA